MPILAALASHEVTDREHRRFERHRAEAKHQLLLPCLDEPAILSALVASRPLVLILIVATFSS